MGRAGWAAVGEAAEELQMQGLEEREQVDHCVVA